MDIRIKTEKKTLSGVVPGRCFLLDGLLYLRLPGDLEFGQVSCLRFSDEQSAWVPVFLELPKVVTPVWLDAVEVREIG